MPRPTAPGDETDATTPDDPGELPHDIDSLARDWITLWQSEIAALAADPETAETTARLAALWAGAASAMLRPMAGAAPAPPGTRHEPAGSPSAAATPGATPPAAAPAAGLDALLGVLGRLDERIGAIERRLAALESGRLRHDHGAPHGRPGGAPGSAKRGRRRP